MHLLIALGLALASPSTAHPSSPANDAIAATDLDQAVEQLLIERRAAPHWKLTVGEAWAAYADGALTIDHLETGHYRLAYAGGILDVLLEDDGM